MKKNSVIFLITFWVTLAFGQPNKVAYCDSLIVVLSKTGQDTTRYDLLVKLCESMQTFNPILAIQYEKEALALAIKLNDTNRELEILYCLAYIYQLIGESSKSIEILHDLLRQTEKKSPSAYSTALGFIAISYIQQEDWENALIYERQSYLIMNGLRKQHKWFDNRGEVGAPMFLSKIFMAMNQMDSALIYAQMSYKALTKLDSTESFHWMVSLALGDVYMKLGKLDLAKHYYRNGYKLTKKQDDKEGIQRSQLALAKYFSAQNNPDSVAFYALPALEVARKNQNYSDVKEASLLLRFYYEKQGNASKALYFNDLAIAAKDSIANIKKVKAVQSLTFKEEKRQQDIEFAKKEARNQIIQYALIGGLVLFSLIVLLLYHNNRQKQHANSLLASKNAQIETEKARAEESERFKTRFLATMSHEIRTPMNAISGMSELLYDTPLDQRQRRYVEGIRASSDNLLVVINDILDFSKLEAGRMLLENAPFSPTDLLHHIEQTLRFQAEEKALIFMTEIHPSVPHRFMGDIARLQQILLNLAGNAIKFTEKGSVTVRITPSPTENRGKNIYRFEVVDTGIGIAPEQQASIFEQFQQADTSISRRYGGTGLGLTISCQILKLYNAELHLKSEICIGSTFFFDLILEEPTAETLAFLPKSNAFDDYESLEGLRVLIAEDNAYNQIVITESLEKWVPDIVLTLAENGHQVLEHLDKNDFDLILMDIQMPQLNGYDTTRHIRKDFTDLKKRDIPIIALTASVTQEETHESFDAGMNAVVRKPFRVEDLLREIRHVLGKSLQPPNDESNLPPSVSQALDTPKSDFDTPDFTFLYKFTGGDAEAMHHWKDRFRNSAPLSISKLSAAITNNKADDFCKIAHAFRPQLDMMGLTKPSRLLLEMEENVAQSRDFKEIIPHFSKFQSDIERRMDLLFSIR